MARKRQGYIVYAVYYNENKLGVGITHQPLSTNDRVRFEGVTYIVGQVQRGRLDLCAPTRQYSVGDITIIPV